MLPAEQLFVQAGMECLETLNLPALRSYFTATVFLKMSKDLQGMISVPAFHHFLVRKNAMLQTVSYFAISDASPTCKTLV